MSKILRALARAVAGVVLLASGSASSDEAVRSGAGRNAPAASASASVGLLLAFSAQEVDRIAVHGPWPPPPAEDPGNALSGQPPARELGALLFAHAGLSPGGVSCAHCHDPARDFTDGRARSMGVAEVDRNATALWNAVHERWQGWDGGADSLWAQSLRALTDRREMASDGVHVQRALIQDAVLSARWVALFGRSPQAMAPQAVLVGVAKVIGAHVATLQSPRTPFDDFRDALLRGDRTAAARYPLAAQRGLRLFVGRGNCHVCHAGPRFTHGEFADIGAGAFVRPGVVDSGRMGGIQTLRASPYNLLSPWSDATAQEAVATRHVEATHRNFGEFKVPGLRQAARTAPYLHDGRLPTLRDVVEHYARLDPERLHADGERLLQPLHLSAQDEDDLLAFLESLTVQTVQTAR
jgi:cytochrome c peroxidase